MNRTIKFRGKRVDNGEWVYGYYLFDPETTLMKSVIYSNRKFIKVIPETVGQFTGLHDKNGKEIYEGDVYSTCDGNETDYMVCFYNGAFCGVYLDGPIEKSLPLSWEAYTLEEIIEGDFTSMIEITGNIHDND